MNMNNNGGGGGSGGYNYNNPYYTAGGATGGAPPPMAGRGGGYTPPPLPQQQQGYPPMDAARGGRGAAGYYIPPAQPPQQQAAPFRGGYVPRGGGTAGYPPVMASQGAYMAQQGGAGGYGAGAGAGGAPYLPAQQQQQQQQQQQRYGYAPLSSQGNSGGAMGGYYPAGGANAGYYPGGGYPVQQQQQMYQQQQQFYGAYGGAYGGASFGGMGGRGGAMMRGGRGRGRGGSATQRHNPAGFLVHVESFAKLDEMGRKGVMDGVIPQQVIYNMAYLVGTAPVRVLVVVAKKYLAARLSFPKNPDDILLSEKTVTDLLDVSPIMGEDGTPFVNGKNGCELPRHLFNHLGGALHVVLPFDKPEQSTEGVELTDVTAAPATTARELMTRRSVFDRVVDVLKEESPQSTEFFKALFHESFAGVVAGTAARGEDDNEEDNEADQRGGADGQAPKAEQKRALVPFNSPQGARILAVVLASEQKRSAFFEMMKPDTKAPSNSRTFSEEVFRALFTSLLSSHFVFGSFGFSTAEVEPEPKAASLKLRPREVDILCEAFTKYGLGVLCNNYGNCLTTTLIRKLRPNFVTYESYYSQQRGHRNMNVGRSNNNNSGNSQQQPVAPQGVKRGRDEEDDGGNQQARVERGTTSGTNAGNEPRITGVPCAPKNLERFTPPAAPSDWRFFYAVAAAFAAGDTGTLKAIMRTRQAHKRNTGGDPQQPQPPELKIDEAEESAEETVESRIKLVTQHVVACRSMQAVIPHFADAVLEAEKRKPTMAKHKAFVAACEAILTAVAGQMATLMAQMYGNYVAQTFIIEIAPRAVPGTKIETIFHSVQSVIVENIVSYGTQKFASNCCERAIVASEGVLDGNEFVVRLAKGLLDKGESLFMQMARNQFGNYVVRHICERLGLYTASDSTASPDVQRAAKQEEKRFFSVLSAHRADLQSTPYGQGLVSWLDRSAARIQLQ